MSTSYAIIIKPYAQRHYIKNFEKKYKGAWDVTWRAVVEEFKRIDSLLQISIASEINDRDNIKICKTEFRVAGTKESRKSSGNRCIIAINKEIGVIYVLLVYHKNDLGNGNETAAWKNMIKENYPEYRNILTL